MGKRAVVKAKMAGEVEGRREVLRRAEGPSSPIPGGLSVSGADQRTPPAVGEFTP